MTEIGMCKIWVKYIDIFTYCEESPLASVVGLSSEFEPYVKIVQKKGFLPGLLEEFARIFFFMSLGSITEFDWSSFIKLSNCPFAYV